MGRHCVRSIPKIKNTTTTTTTMTTTTAAIDTDGNKKQFPPKRCDVGAPHRPALKSMRWGSCQLAPVLKAAEGGFTENNWEKRHVKHVVNNMLV